MKVASRLTPAHVAYLDSVRRGLRETPKAFREELVADLRARLDELPPDAPVVEILGDPAEYARLAREAAGHASHAARPFSYLRALSVRARVLAAVSLVLILVAATVIVGVVHYQPLISDGSYVYGSSAQEIQANVPTDVHFWKYIPGATVFVGTGLENHGRATVTVTGVAMPDESGPFLPTGLRFTRNEQDSGIWQRGAPAKTVAIHPGETVFIFVMMTVAQVKMVVGGSESEAAPSLRLEVLGVHHLLPLRAPNLGVVAQ